jgi:hypothetical protein
VLGDADGVAAGEVGDDERVILGDGAVEVRVDDLPRSRSEDLPQLELRSCERNSGSVGKDWRTGEQEQVQKDDYLLCEMLVRLAGISWAKITSA